MPTIVTKTCKSCGGEYSFKRNGKRSADGRKYCSHACYVKASRLAQVDCICESCGKTFRQKLNHGQRPRFCSQNCAIDSKRGCFKYTKPEHFWVRVDKSSGLMGCWPVAARLDADGYGIVRYKGETWKAHRLAFFLATGAIDDEAFICHRCVGSRACCNPKHLYAGTPAQNTEDRGWDGNDLQGERNHKAKITASDVREIRRRWQGRESSQSKMAREFGLTPAVVSKIVHRDTWKHIE